jgi:ribonucleoside-diphosphate reductase alpha chain
MMGVLSCEHPDIEAFVEAKREPGRLTHFNLSVQVTDAFMAAVHEDRAWTLRFAGLPERSISARGLWERMLRAAYETAEPGVLFIDRINRENPLNYCERIEATNPCGEVPLPPYGACDLGSLNLSQFVRDPFTKEARLDFAALDNAVPLAVRLLDNVIDASRYPLAEQARTVRSARRIGLGVNGLADALVMLGLVYGEPGSIALAHEVMQRICHAAYRSSSALAREKGSFPAFARDRYLAGAFAARLPADIRDAIARDGLRNSHLLAIAPAGTISLLAGNVSSGLEPIFAEEYARRVATPAGDLDYRLTDYALGLWRRSGRAGAPPAMITLPGVSAEAQLAMQAALQPSVDNAISKTVSVPTSTPFEAFAGIYDRAYDLGLKGCAAYRPNPLRGAVLSEFSGATPCCPLEREPD